MPSASLFIFSKMGAQTCWTSKAFGETTVANFNTTGSACALFKHAEPKVIKTTATVTIKPMNSFFIAILIF